MEGDKKYDGVNPTRWRALAQLLQLEADKLKIHAEMFQQENLKDLSFRAKVLAVAIYGAFPQPPVDGVTIQNFEEQMELLTTKVENEEPDETSRWFWVW